MILTNGVTEVNESHKYMERLIAYTQHNLLHMLLRTDF